MNKPNESLIRVSMPSSARIVDPRDPYTPITSPEPRLYGTMGAQPGEVVYVTLDDGRGVLVARANVTTEAP